MHGHLHAYGGWGQRVQGSAVEAGRVQGQQEEVQGSGFAFKGDDLGRMTPVSGHVYGHVHASLGFRGLQDKGFRVQGFQAKVNISVGTLMSKVQC